MLRLGYLFVLVICILPTLPGLSGVLFSSFNLLPNVNNPSFSWLGYVQVWQWHGVETSLLLSLFSAVFSSYLACFITFAILMACWGKSKWQWLENTLSPLLAMPHVAFAIGFAFLFTPTGIFARLLNTLLGSQASESIQNALPGLIHDPYAIGLTLAIAIKEVPFLLLMSVPILKQLNIASTERICHSLGYNRVQMWWKCILPQWLNKIRFALFAVMAYGISVVDIALVIGPTNPPTFAVLIWQWFNDPDLNLLPRAAAGAILLLIIASCLIALIVAIEKVITKWWHQWQYSGRYGRNIWGMNFFSGLVIINLCMLPLFLLWSIANRWRFPDILPSRFSLRFWETEWQNIMPTLSNSLIIALISGIVTIILAIIAHEYRLKHRFSVPSYWIIVPMLIPQLSLLFGLQITSLLISATHYWLWVLWAHVFFAFPYVYLALDGPWKSYNENYSKTALSLGKSPLHVWLSIKAPLLSNAIIFATAIGISVSLAQYLPTLMLGAGRISTITTEAVALASGFDRRIAAIYGLWQALLPFIFFTLALLASQLKPRRMRLPNKETRPYESLSRKTYHS